MSASIMPRVAAAGGARRALRSIGGLVFSPPLRTIHGMELAPLTAGRARALRSARRAAAPRAARNELKEANFEKRSQTYCEARVRL
jgi:hypothetical protein